jgi:hypothetical protein
VARYVCGHPGHEEDVDLTSLVLLERGASEEVVFITTVPAIKEALDAVPADARGRRRHRLLARELKEVRPFQ